jgi:cell division protein FtsB
MADRDPRADRRRLPAFLRRWVRRASDTLTPVDDPVARAALASSPQVPIDPASLPMPISRRRLAFLAVGLIILLVTVAFGHQVTDAAAASDHAAQLRTANDTLRADLANLQADLGKVQDDTYIAIAARSYDLGAKHEIPVVLAPDAPTLAPDAPGSAAQRIGAEPTPSSPLEAWLDLLFGPSRH